MAKYTIEVFKAGTWTDASGVTRTFAISDIENIAQIYNEQSEHDAPIVIGHPKDDSEVKGWVERLFVKKDKLYATVRDLNSEFIAGVQAGTFRKKSIALYDNMLLRHIGFVPIPAVKGLKDDFEPALFNDNGRAFSEFAEVNPNSSNDGVSAMNEQQFNEIKELLTNILNIVGNKIPNQPNGAVPPPANPQMMGGQPYGMAPAYNQPMFSDPQMNAAWNQFAAQYVASNPPNNSNNNGNASEVSRLKAELQEATRNATKAEFSEFMKSPEIAVRVPSYMRDRYIGWLCDARAKDDAAQKNGVQFGESNPSEVEGIKATLMQLPKLVDVGGADFAEHGSSQGATETREKQRSEIAKRMAATTKPV